MSVMTLAMILLGLRAVAVCFMVKVLSISYPLLKAANDPEVKPLRHVMFALAAIVAIGNVVPIAIDVYGLLGEDVRTDEMGLVLNVYFLNNAFIAAVSSIFFWLIYKVTGDATIKLEKERNALQSDNDKLHRNSR